MEIRKYKGPSEASVLARIREELGDDAVILHTTVIRPRGLARLFRRPSVEIVAGGGFRIVRDYANGSPPVAPATIIRPMAPPAFSPEHLRREIAELKDAVARRTRVPGFPGATQELHEEYVEVTGQRISDELARSMFDKITETLPAASLRNKQSIHTAMREAIKSSVHCADGIQLQTGTCVRVAFVGPTGVGKTTTIAKLISIYAYRGRSVAVITNDTFRIAAAEQIKRVAQLVGVPIRICRTEAEIRSALAEFANRDLVLIDTAGRSQKDSGKIEDLCATLKILQPDEVHLVLSSTTTPETLVDTVNRFSPTGFSKIVFTKMDEAVKVGLVLDVLSKFNKQLSFITTGQEIPRDIEVADSERLTALILGEEQL